MKKKWNFRENKKQRNHPMKSWKPRKARKETTLWNHEIQEHKLSISHSFYFHCIHQIQTIINIWVMRTAPIVTECTIKLSITFNITHMGLIACMLFFSTKFPRSNLFITKLNISPNIRISSLTFINQGTTGSKGTKLKKNGAKCYGAISMSFPIGLSKGDFMLQISINGTSTSHINKNFNRTLERTNLPST